MHRSALLRRLATPTALALLICAAPTFSAGPISISTSRPAQAPTVPRPRLGSLEYRLSWGLSSIDAQRAYARGITGAGVTIAFIDTGIEASHAALGRLSPLSTDLIEARTSKTFDAHGEQVAGLAAAPLDGAGTVGVAYRSTVLAIRADIDGSCAKQCAVRGRDLALGIDYALDQGARIIAVPLVGYQRLPSVEKALQRAVDSGAVIIAAAGNDGVERPAYPARYAADPRFAASIVVAGATTPRGQMSSWSNRAGEAASRYIAAPGDRVVTDCNDKTCQLVSGTSYSTAYIAGALALLLESRPEMSPQQAAELLLQTARKGARPDASTGRGEVDVGRALRVAREQAAAVG